MQSKIIVTADNSKTLLIPELNETYHSTKGAITEALHVFIKEGLNHFPPQSPLNIFEMGFGTGLNALLTLAQANQREQNIQYSCIEAHPLEFETALKMNYLDDLNLVHLQEEYQKMHTVSSNKTTQLTRHFGFTKIIEEIQHHRLNDSHFDLIYYDAFGPKIQEDLWKETVLRKMWNGLKEGGVLTTYCAQGEFKRCLKRIGFEVQTLAGPPGKREMTRAIKR